MDKPACFTQTEWEEWTSAAVGSRPGRPVHLPSPCWDCLPLYAISQRIVGKCEGHPWGVEEDTEPVMSAQTAASVAAKKKRKAEKMAVVIKLWHEGKGPTQIAADTGFALNTVHWYLREWRMTA